MRITVEPTGDFYQMGDLRPRAWTGHDLRHLPVVALILAVTSHTGVPALIPCPPPAPDWPPGVARAMGDLWRLAGQMTEQDMTVLLHCAQVLVKGNR